MFPKMVSRKKFFKSWQLAPAVGSWQLAVPQNSSQGESKIIPSGSFLKSFAGEDGPWRPQLPLLRTCSMSNLKIFTLWHTSPLFAPVCIRREFFLRYPNKSVIRLSDRTKSLGAADVSTAREIPATTLIDESHQESVANDGSICRILKIHRQARKVKLLRAQKSEIPRNPKRPCRLWHIYENCSAQRWRKLCFLLSFARYYNKLPNKQLTRRELGVTSHSMWIPSSGTVLKKFESDYGSSASNCCED